MTGPGCLMYAVILPYAQHPALRILEQAHRFVLGIMARAISQAIGGVEPIVQCGTSDLAIANRKFSGNSLRCKRDHLLYHGTILYDFPLDLVTACLGTPPGSPTIERSAITAAFVTQYCGPRDDTASHVYRRGLAGDRQNGQVAARGGRRTSRQPLWPGQLEPAVLIRLIGFS